MTRNGYTAIPVLEAEQYDMGIVGEGDFLRHVLDAGSLDKMDMESHRGREFVRRDFCPPISIDADETKVVSDAQNLNFVRSLTAKTHFTEI